MTRATPSVSFNLTDEYEKELYEYALSKEKYFSRYVKRLIERERAGGAVMPVMPTIPNAPVLEERPTKISKAAVKHYL